MTHHSLPPASSHPSQSLPPTSTPSLPPTSSHPSQTFPPTSTPSLPLTSYHPSQTFPPTSTPSLPPTSSHPSQTFPPTSSHPSQTFPPASSHPSQTFPPTSTHQSLQPASTHVCPICSKVYKYQFTLLKHMKSTHPNVTINSNNPVQCKESNCFATFRYVGQLRHHLQEQHSLNFSTETQEFKTIEGTCIYMYLCMYIMCTHV